MSQETWSLIKRSKGFYIKTYRAACSAVVVSLIVNSVLCLTIYYVGMHPTARDYYATNGEKPPIRLTAIDSPNNTSVPLLPDDPVNDDETRVIPQ